jgi:hypothetical protein
MHSFVLENTKWITTTDVFEGFSVKKKENHIKPMCTRKCKAKTRLYLHRERWERERDDGKQERAENKNERKIREFVIFA